MCDNYPVIPQFGGTCWFNVIITACCYSENLKKLMITKSKKWDKSNSFFKYLKTVLKYSYSTDNKTKRMFIKQKPEYLLFKYLNYFDKSLKKIMRLMIHYYLNDISLLVYYNINYIITFFRKIGVNCLDIIILDNNEYLVDFDKNINLKPNSINDKGAYGADISSVQLNGPRCYNFANNTNTSELYEFSILLTVKIKEITEKNNIIFEMIGNSNEYKISIVHINLQLNENKNIDVILQIGDVNYNGLINNIDKNIIKSGDFIVIGLIYSKKEIKFMLNKQIYKYENKNTFDITLGSTPLVINKKGIIDMELYNFIYYKSIIPSKEYLNYFKHVYYYLSGLHTAISSSVPSPVPSPVPSLVPSSPVPSSSVLNDNNNENYKKFKTKLEELEYNIQQNLNKKEIETNIDEIKPFNLI